ncbi:MAG TPA: AraC family transcriptional regulator [Polyangiaceae bacterium]|jgi:AraC-like DNA-binding protein|nr:AraC family transcriptional regulator [Polyangiaceae bacterium]
MRLARTPLANAGGALPIWPPLLATRGPGAESGVHSHHAMHLVLAVTGSLRVTARDAMPATVAGVLTAPDVAHSIDARGVDVVLVFLEPESEVGALLAVALGGELRPIDDAERALLLDGASPETLMGAAGAEWTRRAASVLGAGTVAAKRTVHPRVKKLLGVLRNLPPDGDTSLETLAAAVELSPGRLMHAFTESIGVPLRPYLQWLKLQRAASAIVSGMPLAAAAHAAGFSDAAHMSRTFRQTLGTTPSALRPR